MTYEQVLQKLTALCARSECCSKEMLDKMRKWEVDEADQARAMAFLIEEKYIDDRRYAACFIKDKVRFNKWGRRKVEMALRAKGITPDVYSDLFDEVEEEQYLDVLRPLLAAKKRTVTGKTPYDIRAKLIRFGLSRGFDYALITKVLSELSVEGDDDDFVPDE